MNTRENGSVTVASECVLQCQQTRGAGHHADGQASRAVITAEPLDELFNRRGVDGVGNQNECKIGIGKCPFSEHAPTVGPLALELERIDETYEGLGFLAP